MEDIKRVQLSEIVELITKGTTPTTLGYEFQDEGVNFLKIECFDENGGFIESKVAHISEECHKKMKRSQLKNGDILFSIAGAIGRVAIVTEEMLPANINQALAIIRISDGQVYLPYIKLILTSPIVIEQFERKKQGVAQLNLSLKDINEISIPLPSKDKQIELAELFDKVVGVILKRNKELSALDDLIKARFVEMFGDAVHNDKGWKTDAVKNLCKEIYGGGTPSKSHPEYYEEGDVPGVSSKDMKTDILTDSQIKINQLGVENSTAKMVPVNSVIMVIRSGILKHTLPVAINAVPITVNQDLKVFIPNERIIARFLAVQFKMHEQDILTGVRAVTADNIEFNSLKQRELIVPPIELQQEYVSFLEQVDKSKVAVQKALEEMQLLFDSLMQQYFG